jgi:hypothetical protein
MNIEEIVKKIIDGRDFSKPVHENLIRKELEKLAEALQKDAVIIRKALDSLSKKLPFTSNEYLSVREVAKYLKIGKSTLTSWVKNGVFLVADQVSNKTTSGVKNKWKKKDVAIWREENQALLEKTYIHGHKSQKALKEESKQLQEKAEDFNEVFMDTLKEFQE